MCRINVMLQRTVRLVSACPGMMQLQLPRAKAAVLQPISPKDTQPLMVVIGRYLNGKPQEVAPLPPSYQDH